MKAFKWKLLRKEWRKHKIKYPSPDEQRARRSDSSLKTGTGEITPCLTSGVENRNWRVQSPQRHSVDWSLVRGKFDGKGRKNNKSVPPRPVQPAPHLRIQVTARQKFLFLRLLLMFFLFCFVFLVSLKTFFHLYLSDRSHLDPKGYRQSHHS